MGDISAGLLSELGVGWEAPEPPGIQWDEEPVPLDVFMTDPGYLATYPLGQPYQYEAVRHAERIFFPSAYEELARSDDKGVAAYWSRPARMCNLLTLEWGKGSGKDHICRVISMRIAYLLLCLPSPQEYYGLPEHDTIHTLNVASSSRQASRAFFAPMRRYVTRPGGWFQRHGVQAYEVTAGQRLRQQRNGEAALALQDTIRYPKNIESISGHSDAESQEGLNLILGIADEIDAFKRREELARYHAGQERDSTRSAEGIIDMLRTSATTRFPETYKNIYISYPRYLGSMIQVLIQRADKDIAAKGGEEGTSRHYASGPLATWEVNPRFHGKGKEAFAHDYEDDPVLAAARLECKPSRAINPYFHNEASVRAAFSSSGEPVSVGYQVALRGRSWHPSWQIAAEPIAGAQYAVHADLALTGDRAGIAVAHVKSWGDYEIVRELGDGQVEAGTERRPVVKCDLLFAFEADKKVQPPREIQVRWAREFTVELLRRGWNIRLFTTDGFESADTRQIMESQYGVQTAVVSADRAAALRSVAQQHGLISHGEALWRNLRDLFSEGRLEIMAGPLTEPVPKPGDEKSSADLAFYEILALSRMPNGKIDHPPGGSKDLADALAGAVAGAVFLGGQEAPSGERAWAGSGLTTWTGAPDEEAMPSGINEYWGLSFGKDPLKIAEHEVVLDGRGMPLGVQAIPDWGDTAEEHFG